MNYHREATLAIRKVIDSGKMSEMVNAFAAKHPKSFVMSVTEKTGGLTNHSNTAWNKAALRVLQTGVNHIAMVHQFAIKHPKSFLQSYDPDMLIAKSMKTITLNYPGGDKEEIKIFMGDFLKLKEICMRGYNEGKHIPAIKEIRGMMNWELRRSKYFFDAVVGRQI